MYRKQKMTSTPQVDVEELKRQLRMEVLGDLRPILEASGIQLPNIGGVMSDEERRSSLASTAAGGGPCSIENNMQTYFIGRRKLSNRGRERASVSMSDHA
jgi:hypothetical protein